MLKTFFLLLLLLGSYGATAQPAAPLTARLNNAGLTVALAASFCPFSLGVIVF